MIVDSLPENAFPILRMRDLPGQEAVSSERRATLFIRQGDKFNQSPEASLLDISLFVITGVMQAQGILINDVFVAYADGTTPTFGPTAVAVPGPKGVQ